MRFFDFTSIKTTIFDRELPQFLSSNYIPWSLRMTLFILPLGFHGQSLTHGWCSTRQMSMLLLCRLANIFFHMQLPGCRKVKS
jgi:hypothetical protein